jgi:glycosyltransferase involved in cell wall biosynthesis
MESVSVVVCTFNRAELLGHCLASYSVLNKVPIDVEVIVVDNNSSDNTREVAEYWGKRLSRFRYVLEERQGLSHARNRGLEVARGDYVYYIDDDVILDADFLVNSLRVIREVSPLIFGGPFAPWYHYGRPNWFHDRYASSDLRYTTRRILPRGKFLTGCNFCIHRSLFEQFGPFDPRLGMRGGQVGYGEETELQRAMQDEGVSIWFDPSLKMEHVVNPERLTVDWYIQSGWALGRDRVLSGKVPRSTFYLLTVLAVGLSLTVVTGIVCAMRLLLQRSYFIENWWIDTFRKAAKRAAILYTISLKRY